MSCSYRSTVTQRAALERCDRVTGFRSHTSSTRSSPMAPTKRRTAEELAAQRDHAAKLLDDGVPLAMAARTLQLIYGVSRSTSYEDVEAAEQLRSGDHDSDAPAVYEMRDAFMAQTAALALVAAETGNVQDYAKLVSQWKALASMGGHASLQPAEASAQPVR